ncbi:hypothetical protein [Kitasatospora sp. NPDC097691]|uniref:hypothetical protein n=1 Tax=Kitasatospora sp. NPDC097691 TaxID=3157231 RepID=UPI00331A46D0
MITAVAAPVTRVRLTQPGYLCHFELTRASGELVVGGRPRHAVPETPGQAVRWLRRAARRLAPVLDQTVAPLVAAWLDDAPGYHLAVGGLRRGEAFLLAVSSPGLIFRLEARPVMRLKVKVQPLHQIQPSGPTPPVPHRRRGDFAGVDARIRPDHQK